MKSVAACSLPRRRSGGAKMRTSSRDNRQQAKHAGQGRAGSARRVIRTDRGEDTAPWSS